MDIMNVLEHTNPPTIYLDYHSVNGDGGTRYPPIFGGSYGESSDLGSFFDDDFGENNWWPLVGSRLSLFSALTKFSDYHAQEDGPIQGIGGAFDLNPHFCGVFISDPDPVNYYSEIMCSRLSKVP